MNLRANTGNLVLKNVNNSQSRKYQLFAWWHIHSKWRVLITVLGLLALTLALSSCSYPGQDPPCVGANQNQPGCVNPSTDIKDADNGGDWYQQWTSAIVRMLLSSVAINAVKIGVAIFWNIFTKLASTDFASCTTSSTSTPTCTTVSTFNSIQTVALVFVPLILIWKFFKGYFIGAFIQNVYESAVSFIPRVVIGVFAIAYMAVLVSTAFGLSNELFISIVGGMKNLNDLSATIVGSQDCANQNGQVVCVVSGIQSIQSVQDVGLVALMTIVCLILAAVYIILGLCFFLRTILIFILFCLSPLAIIAGLTEEFKHWFGRWMESMQMMLIAPIPVAVCLALTTSFLQVLPGAHDDPANFVLQLIYVIAFLAVGAVLMFKIAGQTGGFMFGLATAGIAALGGYAAGKIGSGKLGPAVNKESEPIAEPAPISTSLAPVTSAPTNLVPATVAATTEAAVGATAGQQMQQTELISALRAMNANTSASMMMSATNATATSYNRTGSGADGSNNSGFNYGVHNFIQSTGHWAGHEAGIHAPYYSFAPTPNGNSSGNGAESESYTSYSYSNIDVAAFISTPNREATNKTSREQDGYEPTDEYNISEMPQDNYGDKSEKYFLRQSIVPVLESPERTPTKPSQPNYSPNPDGSGTVVQPGNDQYQGKPTQRTSASATKNPLVSPYGERPELPSIENMKRLPPPANAGNN